MVTLGEVYVVAAIKGKTLDISLSGLSLKISLMKIDGLKPHEEVIVQQVHELTAKMREKNEVRDPLMVDNKDLVILDGMHRYQSLKKLGCIFAPCCLVDYDAPEIKVGSWFRFLRTDDYDSVAQKTLDELHLTCRKSALADFDINLDHAMIITKRSVYERTEAADSFYKARLAVNIERSLITQGFEIQYDPENTIKQKLENNTSNFAIPLPIFAKPVIREIASRGQLLPHKVTRHHIPLRPLLLDVPLPLLQDPTVSIMEANDRLDQFLSKKHMDRKPPGSVIDGRRYQEELLVFSTK